MNCREEHPEFIGVSSSLKELPSIVFKDQEGSQSLLQIHNTDLNLSSRVLEIQFIEDQGAYQPGTYPYLKAAIEFYPDKLVLKYAIEELERQRKINLGKPKYCFIVPSKSCMFKCKTCNMWKLKRDSDEMTIEEWKKCLGELADFAGSPMVLQFLGGEPLMKEGIIDLVAFADKKGYNTVLTTNGYLIDEDMAKKIGDSGLVTINLSLHSLKEQTHDFITGIKGSFRRLMNAIELLHKYRINTSIGIDTLILDVNLDELVEMVEWVNSDKRLWRIFFLACVQPFVQEPDSLWYTREENESLWPKDLLTVHRVLDELISLKEKGYKIDNPIVQLNLFKGYFEDPYGFIKSTAARKGNCPRGDAALEISPTGEVSLCFYMEFFGNVRNNSIKDLWYLPKVSGIQKAINNCRMECDLVVNCPYDVEDSVLERK
jgi:MoaA/NifB/PqqE/SkfB family radical SAM enzyme